MFEYLKKKNTKKNNFYLAFGNIQKQNIHFDIKNMTELCLQFL